MRWLETITLKQVAETLGRYKTVVALLLGIWLIAVYLPGPPPERTVETTGGGRPGRQTFSAGEATDGQTAAAGSQQSTGVPGTRTTAGGRLATSEQAAADPNCDPSTGRIRVPSKFSPPCVGWQTGADNGGATYQGVTKDKIRIAVYRAQENAAATAILAGAGASDTREQGEATRKDYVDLYQQHYETYGRKIELVYVDATGPPEDDAAAKADAIKVATEIKAFAAWGLPPNAFVNELVARKVMCICTTSLPIETYLKWAPYAGYTPLMASTQGYVHRAEYIGKRLARKNAKWAGDATMAAKARSFAIVYFETADSGYKSGVDFFEDELQNKYGVRLDDRIAYVLNLSRAQEDARVIISRLKDKGITSVIFSGDPIMPIFLTKEATNQRYFPEWIITGSALTDTTFFARTYDQVQWAHAFGVSYLAARGPEELSDPYRLHVWHHGRPPAAKNGYAIIHNIGPWIFALGVHLAGPKLTPHTFRDGLFSYPPTGGTILSPHVSYGKHGIWQWDDYLAYDDATEIWWDSQERGKDEIARQEGVGMYRYVDGGKRYLPGEWPSTEPKAFDKNGTVVVYDKVPPEDKWPEYEHKHYK